jgi:hypothetical protein
MASPFRLLDFPDEILFLVAECLQSCRRDLCAFSCVSVRFSSIADPCYYRRLLIKSDGQAKRLSKAVQRKPQRLAFIQELILVPAIEHTSNIIIDSLYLILQSTNMLQHLTVELPFHDDYSTAASLKRIYQDRFGDFFEAASLVSCVANPRTFHRLRSCEFYLSFVA